LDLDTLKAVIRCSRS